MTAQITEAGIYDIPEDLYHGDPVPEGSLSVSGAKKLLPPSCPAIFQYDREHRRAPSKSMELGTVVHGLVLGTGQPVEVVDAKDWRTKAAQTARDEAIAAGKVPMLTHEHAKATAIAAAVRSHPVAGPLYAEGDAEQSMFWRCPEFGIWKRGRTDWVTLLGTEVIIADLKTCDSAAPEKIAKSVAEYGYYMQDPWYREGLQILTGADPDFLFVFVQTTAPYLVSVVRLAPEAAALGYQRARLAIERYRDCTESGIWPGYGDDIQEIALPRWQERQIESEIELVYGY